MHFLLIYDVGPDFIERRAEFRDEHLALAWAASDRGELIAGGALEEPTEQAFILFQSWSPEAAEQFAQADPYVRHGLVKRWRVVKWNTVAGQFAASPIRPVEEFHAKLEASEGRPGYMGTGLVKVFRRVDGVDEQIGEYHRNYPSLYHTFHPFRCDGRWFALYSTDYTATRIMELPSCRDIGGEEPENNGFCPVDYYVPFDHPEVVKTTMAGRFGFVAGCIWGDDSSWKIQYLDLTRVTEGILVRQELFDYVAMPRAIVRLRDCIRIPYYKPGDLEGVELLANIWFDLATGEQIAI